VIINPHSLCDGLIICFGLRGGIINSFILCGGVIIIFVQGCARLKRVQIIEETILFVTCSSSWMASCESEPRSASGFVAVFVNLIASQCVCCVTALYLYLTVVDALRGNQHICCILRHCSCHAFASLRLYL